MSPGPKPTPALIERDYGIFLTDPTQREKLPLFASPSRHTEAAIYLMKQTDIGDLVQEIADERGLDPETLYKKIEYGAKFYSHGSTALLDKSGRQVVRKVSTLRNGIYAQVSAREKDAAPHKVWLQPNDHETFYGLPKDIDCQCSDHSTGNPKGSRILCTHIEALWQAINADNRSRAAKEDENNITHTTPSERQPHDVVLNSIFNIVGPPYTTQKRNMLKNFLYDRFVRTKGHPRVGHYSASKQLLHWGALLDGAGISEATFNLLKQGVARFGVLRQDQEYTDTTHLTSQQQELYGSIRELNQHIIDHLLQNRYRPMGYGIVYRDSPHEMMGPQFIRHDVGASHMITIATAPTNDPENPSLPLLVHNRLGPFSNQWYMSADPKPDLAPLRRRRKEIITVEDSTRRDSTQHTFMPVESRMVPIPQELRTMNDYVSRIARRAYESAMNSGRQYLLLPTAASSGIRQK
jgi:hypothetical protein